MPRDVCYRTSLDFWYFKPSILLEQSDQSLKCFHVILDFVERVQFISLLFKHLAISNQVKKLILKLNQNWWYHRKYIYWNKTPKFYMLTLIFKKKKNNAAQTVRPLLTFLFFKFFDLLTLPPWPTHVMTPSDRPWVCAYPRICVFSPCCELAGFTAKLSANSPQDIGAQTLEWFQDKFKLCTCKYFAWEILFTFSTYLSSIFNLI